MKNWDIKLTENHITFISHYQSYCGMGEKVKKGDFVEIEYKGFVEGQLFDTTDAKEAQSLGFKPNLPYGYVRIRVGEGHLLKGLDENLEGRETEKEYKITLPPEKAFGKKSAELIKMIPKNKFTRSNVNPQPGLTVNIDGVMAQIKTVSGGRVLVDFNHPLSNKEVTYKYKILRKIKEDKDIIECLMAVELNLIPENYKLDIKEGKAEIKIKEEFKKELEFDKNELIKLMKENTKLKEVRIN
jgi:FKBP-type peptidyl-prolyl cis-trans isomerase 2